MRTASLAVLLLTPWAAALGADDLLPAAQEVRIAPLLEYAAAIPVEIPVHTSGTPRAEGLRVGDGFPPLDYAWPPLVPWGEVASAGWGEDGGRVIFDLRGGLGRHFCAAVAGDDSPA